MGISKQDLKLLLSLRYGGKPHDLCDSLNADDSSYLSSYDKFNILCRDDMYGIQHFQSPSLNPALSVSQQLPNTSPSAFLTRLSYSLQSPTLAQVVPFPTLLMETYLPYRLGALLPNAIAYSSAFIFCSTLATPNIK
jgi:hypothetical protein